jgi:hypothetical protein
MAALLTLALVLVGLSVGRASDRDEAVVSRQRGHKVKIQLSEAAGPELSRLER